MSINPNNFPVGVQCFDEDCVEVWLDLLVDDPVELFVAGPPGPIGGSAKQGVILGANFSGTPLKYTVAFISPYQDTNYGVIVCGQNSRSFTYENKTVNGFTINSNASTPFSGEVSWFTTEVSS